jgi:hypothetical protein
VFCTRSFPRARCVRPSMRADRPPRGWYLANKLT